MTGFCPDVVAHETRVIIFPAPKEIETPTEGAKTRENSNYPQLSLSDLPRKKSGGDRFPAILCHSKPHGSGCGARRGKKKNNCMLSP